MATQSSYKNMLNQKPVSKSVMKESPWHGVAKKEKK